MLASLPCAIATQLPSAGMARIRQCWVQPPRSPVYLSPLGATSSHSMRPECRLHRTRNTGTASRLPVAQALSNDGNSTQIVSLPPDNYNVSLLKLTALTGGTLVGAYVLHPTLLDMVTDLWKLDAEESNATGSYESNFFSFVSIVYAIMIGNTFTFLYSRQERIIQELYAEVFCVEVLLQEICLAVDYTPTRCHLIQYLRQYVVEELYNPLEMQSPFQAGSPLLAILTAVRTFKGQGQDAGGLLRACEALAAAQSSRSASASQILPGVHWLFIYSVLFLLVVTSLIFEATSENPDLESRRLIFSAECGLLSVIVQLLRDLAKPLDGLYTFRGALDERLSYVVEELDNCLTDRDAEMDLEREFEAEIAAAAVARRGNGNGLPFQ